MATITVDIKALTGSFSTDLKRVDRESRSVFANIERDAKRMGKAIGAGVAAGVAAMAALTKSAINTADEMGKAAQRIGIATPELSKLSYAAKLADVDLGQLSNGITQLTKRMAENKDVFAAIGVQVTDSSGKLRKANEVFADVAEVFAGLEDGATKTRLAVDLFGRSGTQLIPMLNAGRDGLREMGDEAQELGVVISDDLAKAAEAFNDDLTRLGIAFDGIFVQVGREVLPALNELIQAFKDPEFRQGITSIAVGAAEAIVQVAKLVSELGNLTRFAGEAIAARAEGANSSDVVRLEDAVERQREIIRQLDQAGTGAERRNTSSYAEEQRRELIKLTAQLHAAREAAEVLAIQQFNLEAAASKATEGTKEQTQAEKDAARAKQELESRLKSYISSLGDSGEAEKALAKAERERAKALREAAADWKKLDDLHQRELMSLEEEALKRREAQAAFDARASDIENEIRLLGLSTKERKKAVIALEAERLARGENGVVVEKERKRYQDLLTTLQKGDSQKALRLELDRNSFSDLLSDIDKLREAIEGAFDPEIVEALTAQISGKTLNSFQALLGAVQTFTSEGSKGFKNIEKGMAALSLIQDIIALKAAVTAVLTQGEGEPYSAWARMAAMAAAVAPILASIGQTITSFGGGGGGGSNGAASRQERQGTGTVLGDFEAKSESIANAIEITADATSELVGINRGMLTALQAMQRGISGAAGSVSRTGFADLQLSEGMGMNSVLNPFGVSTIGGSIISGMFGGDQDLIDQGLLIRGGTFNNISANPNASSYQTIETDGGWFGSDDLNDELEALSDAANTQIRLILTSIGDAVREGAEALGLDMVEINRAIEEFRLEEIRISTMDLTGEEAQAELEAVFSSIFDNLAAAVVPFIDQFQRVGEGLGETLVRVATSVQVTQEAVTQLGLSLDELDPETMAQVSVALIDAVGSIEDFIQGMQSFVANFAPESHRFAVAQDELTRAFAEAGLTLPTTRDGMWQLMQSLDATTESGRQQIAMLLRLSDTADTYYDQLERNAEEEARAQEARQNAARDYAEFVGGFGETGSDFQRQLRSVRMQMQESIRTANELARAAGLQSAREEDLINIREQSSQQIAELIAGLTQTVVDQIAELYGTSVDKLESQIAEIDRQISEIDRSDSGFGMIQAIELERQLGAERRRLQAELSDALKEQERVQRRMSAFSLAQNLADLGLARGLSFEELAKELGLDIARFGRDLGIRGAEGVGSFIRALEADSLTADVFGEGVDEIVNAILGVNDNLMKPIRIKPDGSGPIGKPGRTEDPISKPGRTDGPISKPGIEGGKSLVGEVIVDPISREDPASEMLITEVRALRRENAELLGQVRQNTGRSASELEAIARSAVRDELRREGNLPRGERLILSRPKAGR